MTRTPSTPSLLRWLLAPNRAIATQVEHAGLDRRASKQFLRQARRRRKAWLPLVAAIQIGVMFGWIGLVSTTVGIYEQTTHFGPDGSVMHESTTGPFGITTAPLVLGLLAGPVMALLVGALAGLAAHYLLIDREARRCLQTPACFSCGYDLTAAASDRCPECGDRQPHVSGAAGPTRGVP
ncbi:MAG: hypothetical protein RIB58_01195 [Phycisphaerales bacterium]